MITKSFLFTCFNLLYISLYLFAAESLLQNSGFENGNGAFPENWEQDRWIIDKTTTEYIWSKEGVHSGNRCLVIKNNAPNDARIVQKINLEPNTFYQFSCWIKTENIGDEGNGANLSFISYNTASIGKHGSHDWEEITIYIKNGATVTVVPLSLGIGGYGAISAGTAWFDDVSLVIVDTIPGNATTLNLSDDNNVSEADINKFKFKIEQRPDYWVLTILLVAAGIALLFVIMALLKKQDNTKKGG